MGKIRSTLLDHPHPLLLFSSSPLPAFALRDTSLTVRLLLPYRDRWRKAQDYAGGLVCPVVSCQMISVIFCPSAFILVTRCYTRCLRSRRDGEEKPSVVVPACHPSSEFCGRARPEHLIFPRVYLTSTTVLVGSRAPM